MKAPWCGIDAVYKVRRKLPYRLPVLDSEIRRQRTLREADLIGAAKKAGVHAPYLYFLDLNNATLVMEYVSGERMKDLVDTSPSKASDLFEKLGGDAARLHSAGIMHGDLTTANVVLRGGDLVLIDFGLSARTHRVEDHAVDLRLIKETIVGAHSEVARQALDGLMEGYRQGVGNMRSKSVFRQLQSIERRGRYARVD